MDQPELEDLADAITALAEARHRIPTDRLLNETALNVLILSRIASNQMKDPGSRIEIDRVTDDLVDLLRGAAVESR